jgi:hypothetical protein
MGLLFTPERKETLKDQIDRVKAGEATSLVIPGYVTEEELSEVFELETLTSLDISFALISKNELR